MHFSFAQFGFLATVGSLRVGVDVAVGVCVEAADGPLDDGIADGVADDLNGEASVLRN